jgi:excisionase family DNA binding protein
VEISAAEAADRLGLNIVTVRRLAADGHLTARKVGGVWMVSDADITALSAEPRGRGRRLSARSAWAVLDLLSGIIPDGLSRSELQRARVRAGKADELSPGELSERAHVRRLRGPKGSHRHLLNDSRVVRSGISAPGDAGLGLVASEELEGYVRGDDLEAIISKYGLRPADRGRADIVLRVPEPRWPFGAAKIAPPAVAAADLLDAGDSRSVDAARDVLRRLAKETVR